MPKTKIKTTGHGLPKNRITAIHIIEEIIEPLLYNKFKDEKGLNGEEYYTIEDEITELIKKYK